MDKNRLIAIGIAVAVLIPLITFVIIPVASGSTRFLIVLSGSMSPAMESGDIAVVTQIDPSELNVGDIVAYKGTDNPDKIISHRVIEVINNGELSFRTKGDANDSSDFSLVGSSDVVGKVTLVVPKVGYIFNFAKTPSGFAILVVAPAVLLIAIEIRKIAGYVRQVESNRGKQQSRGKRRTVRMRRYERITAICMSVLIVSSIALSLVAYTSGYLSDSETSSNNVIAAGVWGQVGGGNSPTNNENSGGGENSPTDNVVINGENSGGENLDNGNPGGGENSPTDNVITNGENSGVGMLLVYTKNSEVTKNMTTVASAQTLLTTSWRKRITLMLLTTCRLT